MNSNYYRPDIKDFHDGFECEIQSSYGWQKGNWPNILMSDTLTFQCLIDKGIIEATKKCSIRVPYLTEQQIEQEGWLPIENTSLHKGSAVFEYSKLWYEHKVFCILHGEYNEDRSINLKISITLDSYLALDVPYSIYRGVAKSINEFRTLCKWLEL